jgi:hypothetical protein
MQTTTSPAVAAILAMPDDLPFEPSPAKAELTIAITDDAQPTGVALPAPLARTFMLAGNATFTVVSNATGKRFTFKMRRPDDVQPGTTRIPYFLKVLTGADNENSYEYMGQFWVDGEKVTYSAGRKSRIAADAPSQRAAMWLASAINHPEKLAQCTIYHAGKCGRCGRTLTVPGSIQTGLGPECATRM